MPVNSLDDLWRLICEECKNTVTEVAFDTFFTHLSPVAVDNGAFVISCDNEYLREVIEKTYTPVLSDALFKILGVETKPHIIFEGEEQNIIAAELHGEGLSFEDFFTFDNFIIGSTNRFAHAAALAVAQNERIIYNPFIIYGPSGVGKTHLMLAIKNEIKKLFPYKKVAYIRSEDFTNQLINALKDGSLGMSTMDDFHNKYRNLDVLLIDDIHFIAGKEATQEEFFNTFNTLYQNGKQIIVTLDRPIKEIKTLDERIRSRLSSGLFADMSSPDFETRVGIIRKKAEESGLRLEENLIYYIAEHIKVNTRQLEGVVKKLVAFVQIQHKEPNIGIVQTYIKEAINDSKPEPIKVEKIISEVAKSYNVSESDILSPRRTAQLALARQVAMYISKETTDLSYKQIGEKFNKDHSTVLYNVKTVSEYLAEKPYEKELVNDIIKNLKGQ